MLLLGISNGAAQRVAKKFMKLIRITFFILVAILAMLTYVIITMITSDCKFTATIGALVIVLFWFILVILESSFVEKDDITVSEDDKEVLGEDERKNDAIKNPSSKQEKRRGFLTPGDRHVINITSLVSAMIIGLGLFFGEGDCNYLVVTSSALCLFIGEYISVDVIFEGKKIGTTIRNILKGISEKYTSSHVSVRVIGALFCGMSFIVFPFENFIMKTDKFIDDFSCGYINGLVVFAGLALIVAFITWGVKKKRKNKQLSNDRKDG